MYYSNVKLQINIIFVWTARVHNMCHIVLVSQKNETRSKILEVGSQLRLQTPLNCCSPLQKSPLLFLFYRAITFNIGTITDPAGRFQAIQWVGRKHVEVESKLCLNLPTKDDWDGGEQHIIYQSLCSFKATKH